MSSAKDFVGATQVTRTAKRAARVSQAAKWGRVVRGATLLVAIFTSALFARAQSTDAVITGAVTDTQGGVLPGVTVTAVNADNGLTRTAVTGDDGQYRIAPLPPGTYSLTAEQAGFSPLQLKGLVLTIGLELPENITLEIGSVTQSVTVTTETPAVQTTNSEVASDIVDRLQVDSLPITQRQAAMLALLEPGTTSDAGRVSRPLASVGAGAVNPAGTNYLLDGLSNVISGNGDPRDLVQEATVQEFKVIVAQAPAEYGFRAAGVVTVASKGGTNQFHGEAFEYFRDHYINRLDTLSQELHNSNPAAYPIEPFSRNQFGGEIGGPIKKDKLWGLFSFEELDDHEYFTVAPGGFKSPTITAVYAPLEGSFRGGALFREYFGRLDYQFSSKNTAFLRFSEQYPALNYAQSAGGSAAAYSSGDSSTRSWTWALVDTWLISDKTVNQFAAQVSQSWQDTVTPQFSTPSLFPNGSIQVVFPNMTWGFYPGTQFHPFYQEVRDDVTKTNLSHHTFKFGGDLLRTPRKLDSAATPFGVLTLGADYPLADGVFNPQSPNFNWATLADAKPIKFTTTVPEFDYQDENLESAFYFEDEWKVLSNFTLNLGLRYDLQTGVWRNHLDASIYPVPLPYVVYGKHGDFDNLAPRVGFAWHPWKSGRTVIKGGFGIVNVDLQDNAFEPMIYTQRQTQITLTGTTANPIPWPNPLGGLTPQQYAAAHPSSTANVNINANNIHNPQVFTYSLGVARQFTPNLSVNVEGMYTHMNGLIATENVNTPNAVTGKQPWELSNPCPPTPNPATPCWNQINVQAPVGIYNYTGLFVRLDKRFSNHFQSVISYTLAKQYDNYNASTAITDFNNPSEDDGPAATDRRHHLVASGSAVTRHGITVGAILTAESALPFYATAGSDLNKDGSITDYVPGTNKNSYKNIPQMLAAVNTWRATQNLAPIPLSQIQSNRLIQLDARISKDFNIGERYKIQLIGQLFNVLGTNNYGGVGTTQQSNASTGSATSSGTFGTFTAALPRQQGELAVRFVF